MKIGIICPSEIAYRRFLPAIKELGDAEFVGVGVNSPEERYGNNPPRSFEVKKMLERGNDKARQMISKYGGKIFDSFEDILSAPEIDAIYLPLPPALHYKWAKKAIEQGKHVLVEKPATISYGETKELIECAAKKQIALHENYMFMFHNQLNTIEDIIKSGEIGDIRLYRLSFGFPKRATNDFRYNKSLGGGALLDAGGYTLKYATKLLGDSAEIKYAHLNYIDGVEVDVYGSATLVNKNGVTAQVAFGMDNDYKCELEAWGSTGTLKTNRVFTAPPDFHPTLIIKKNTRAEEIVIPPDDAFQKSINCFIQCINDTETRENNYKRIEQQSKIVNDFLEIATNDGTIDM